VQKHLRHAVAEICHSNSKCCTRCRSIHSNKVISLVNTGL